MFFLFFQLKDSLYQKKVGYKFDGHLKVSSALSFILVVMRCLINELLVICFGRPYGRSSNMVRGSKKVKDVVRATVAEEITLKHLLFNTV